MTNRHRSVVTEVIQLLASAESQRAYERDVPLADVAAELFESLPDVVHFKSASFTAEFTEDELWDLAELFGLVRSAARRFYKEGASGVAELQKLEEWRLVMSRAKEIQAYIRNSD